jgi:hypothetical protein
MLIESNKIIPKYIVNLFISQIGGNGSGLGVSGGN